MGPKTTLYGHFTANARPCAGPKGMFRNPSSLGIEKKSRNSALQGFGPASSVCDKKSNFKAPKPSESRKNRKIPDPGKPEN